MEKITVIKGNAPVMKTALNAIVERQPSLVFKKFETANPGLILKERYEPPKNEAYRSVLC